MRSKLKNIGIFLLVLSISFFCVYVVGFLNNCYDPLNSYGFSKAIMMGQVPYRDFNTITTPLYAFYQSIFLLIYDDFIMIMFSQALLVTILSFIIYKLFKYKSFIILPFIFLFSYCSIIPTYNFLCLFMIFLIIYLEKYYKDKDYLIGIVIALAILSKHTTGIFLVLPTIIFNFKNKKKFLKRFIGFFIPCFIFLIYLLVNNAFYDFLNLCLFGLFDFLNDNGVGGGVINYFYIVLSLISFIIAIICLYKNKKDISNYYLIMGSSFVIPLFDAPHVAFWFICFVCMIIPYIKKYDKFISKICFIVFCVFTIMWSCFWWKSSNLVLTKKLNHFKYYIQTEDTYKNLITINEFANEYDDAIILGFFSMQHAIMNDRDISYFNVFLYGNFGFDGVSSMKKRVDNIHDKYFLINIRDHNSDNRASQYAYDIAEYIINNSKKIDENNGFYIYYKE